MVRMLFLRAIHPKIITLGGAFNFQTLLTTLLSLGLLGIAEKKEETEKIQSFEAVHTLASSPLFGTYTHCRRLSNDMN